MGHEIGVVVSVIILAAIIFVFLIIQDVINFRVGEPDIEASLGEKFRVGESHFTKIEEEGLESRILEFVYSPCLEDTYCIWSGTRVDIEFTKDNEIVYKGFELEEDFRFIFDYKVTMLETDYKTYADLKVERV
jgi:hypothetical protein